MADGKVKVKGNGGGSSTLNNAVQGVNNGTGGTGGNGANNENNKECKCSKDTSEKNRNKANSTRSGEKAKCRKCKRTGGQRAAIRRRELMKMNLTPEKLQRKLDWLDTAGQSLHSDHIYPADKIKKLTGFTKLESENLPAARKVMTAQFNMQKLCFKCNCSKGANAEPVKIGERLKKMIQDELKKG